MAYRSCALARVILGGMRNPLRAPRVAAAPLLAAFIMLAWDLSTDPVWSTSAHARIRRNRGTYFGVPLGNFLGWYLSVYLIFQFFAIYTRGRSTNADRWTSSSWQPAVLCYGISAAGNLLLRIPLAAPAVVMGASGAQWRLSASVGASAVVSIFLMGDFVLLALLRLNKGSSAPLEPSWARVKPEGL